MGIELLEFNFRNCVLSSARYLSGQFQTHSKSLDQHRKIKQNKNMSKNVLDAIAPLSLISKFCGYSMFTISRFDFSTATKQTDVCFRIWIVLINCFLNYILWFSDRNFPMHKSDIISKCLPIILGGSYGLYIFTIIGFCGMRDKYSILIKSICEIDEMVRLLINSREEFIVSFHVFS